MADRPIEKKETAKKDEAYQPLWDTDQYRPGIHDATHGSADARKMKTLRSTKHPTTKTKS